MGRIISFFGADGKCGTSQTALSLAVILSQREKLLLVHAEEPLGDDYIPEIKKSMEDIKAYMQGRLWDEEEIISGSLFRKNLCIIGGADRAGSGSMYEPEAVRDFLGSMAMRFDIVLCDCGSELSHGLTLGAMTAADMRLTVLSQSEKALRRYEKMKPLLEKLDLESHAFLCCKYKEDSPCDLEYLLERLSVKDCRTISFSPDGEKAEFYRRPLISFRNKKYSKDIEALASYIGEDGI